MQTLNAARLIDDSRQKSPVPLLVFLLILFLSAGSVISSPGNVTAFMIIFSLSLFLACNLINRNAIIKKAMQDGDYALIRATLCGMYTEENGDSANRHYLFFNYHPDHLIYTAEVPWKLFKTAQKADEYYLVLRPDRHGRLTAMLCYSARDYSLDAELQRILENNKALTGAALAIDNDLIQYIVRNKRITPEQEDFIRACCENAFKEGKLIHSPQDAAADTASPSLPERTLIPGENADFRDTYESRMRSSIVLGVSAAICALLTIAACFFHIPIPLWVLLSGGMITSSVLLFLHHRQFMLAQDAHNHLLCGKLPPMQQRLHILLLLVTFAILLVLANLHESTLRIIFWQLSSILRR